MDVLFDVAFTNFIPKKCDELAPSCSNCIKHSITCDFSLKTPNTVPSAPPRIIPQTPESQSPGFTPGKRSINFTNSHVGIRGPHPLDLRMGDLELLHYFTTETCFTLSNQPRSHRLWQVAVPQEAFHHDFLMRGILAVAALHLSCLRPEKQDDYRRVAVQHQDLALSTFRSIMPAISQSNSNAFFAFSSLIVVLALAAPRTPNSLAFTETSQEPAEWLPLIRGVHSVLMSVWPWIQNGSLGGLLPDGLDVLSSRGLAETANDRFIQLSRLCENASGEQDVLEAYSETIQGLRACYVKLYAKNLNECEVSIAFLWPAMIPRKFNMMLHSRAPEALIILAHYCVILQHLEGYWWKKGWIGHLMASIYRELDQSWHSWIQWPTSLIDRDR